MTEKRRYAQVGLGGRSQMYYRGVIERYTESSEMGVFHNREFLFPAWMTPDGIRPVCQSVQV